MKPNETSTRTHFWGENPLPYPVSIGRIRAGEWASSVPDLLVAEGRQGVQLGEDPSEASVAFERAIHEACVRDPWLRDHAAEVTWPGGQFASGRLERGHVLIEEVMDAAMLVNDGARLIESASPYGSDLRLYVGVGGIPTLHYGRGDVRFAHAPREQVSIAESLRVARAVALIAARRCGARLPR